MSWKDYFYFQKRDKVAIIFLLILITISGGVYIATKPSIRAEAKSLPLETTTKSESFTENTEHIQNEGNKENKERIERRTPEYTYQEKLKKGETIELNSADTSDLKMIPGIGTGFANKIVKYRNALGGYISISQLTEVWGLDDDLYNKITPYITIVPANKKVKINSDDFKTLNKHPYISYQQAQVIIDIRERKGLIESIERLSLLDEFTDSNIKQLKPYISFD